MNRKEITQSFSTPTVQLHDLRPIVDAMITEIAPVCRRCLKDNGILGEKVDALTDRDAVALQANLIGAFFMGET